MQTDKAIISFSQSEKIKAGITWVSNALNIIDALPSSEKKGGEKAITVMINMMYQEIRLAGAVSGLQEWLEIGPHLDKAVMMIDSGVGLAAIDHLTKALSMTTNIGQRSMSALKENNLL